MIERGGGFKVGVYEIELDNLSGYRDYERFMSGPMSFRDLLAIDRLYTDVKRAIHDIQFRFVDVDRDALQDLLNRIDEVVDLFKGVDSGVDYVIEFEVVNDVYVVTYEEVERLVYELNTGVRHLIDIKL